jgi:hypothetical protein
MAGERLILLVFLRVVLEKVSAGGWFFVDGSW